MRVISRKRLRQCWERRDCADAKAPLLAWFKEAEKASWNTPAAIKHAYRHATILPAGRVVFNIAGNKYRIVARINYEYQVLYIRFVGTHAEYDRIDVRTGTISERGCMAKRQMDIRPIRTDADYEWGLQEIERLMDAKAGSSDGDRLDVLATLVSAYEAQHFPMERPDPIAAIEFRMEQRGMTRKDLEKALGGKSRVSEVLNRRRALTVSMIRKLSRSFDIPSDVLIGEYALRKAGGARKGSARGRGRRAG